MIFASIPWDLLTLPRRQILLAFQAFGLRLPSPFNSGAGIGSHLTRLSVPRLKPTSLVHSLYIIIWLEFNMTRVICQGGEEISVVGQFEFNKLLWL